MVNRPFIFCHMLTSLDGKIIGNFMNTSEASTAGNVFYNLAFGEKTGEAPSGGCALAVNEAALPANPLAPRPSMIAKTLARKASPRREGTEMSKNTWRVAVVGAGFSGLISARELERLGHEVEVIEARDPSFAADYFTADECAFVESVPEDARALATTLVWSAKECALKAIGEGLRLPLTPLSELNAARLAPAAAAILARENECRRPPAAP